MMMLMAPSMGRVPALTADKHSAPLTAARMPKIPISRMTIRQKKRFGYLLHGISGQ
jgi:hypothetical protein